MSLEVVTPWWGVSVVAGLFALGAALITLLFTYLRNKREDDRRWEKDLRAACARFATLLEEVALQSDWVNYRENSGPLRIAAFELQLLAPQEVVQLADDVMMKAIMTSEVRASEQEEFDHAVAIARYLMAREAFVNGARKALGVQPLTRDDDVERVLPD